MRQHPSDCSVTVNGFQRLLFGGLPKIAGINAGPEKEMPEFGGYRPESPPQDAQKTNSRKFWLRRHIIRILRQLRDEGNLDNQSITGTRRSNSRPRSGSILRLFPRQIFGTASRSAMASKSPASGPEEDQASLRLG